MLERRKSGPPFAVVGQVNGAMPYMEGEAEVPGSALDHILEGPAFEFPLFAPPKEAVSLQDYAAAIHTAALVEDRGPVRLGIGAFSDALTPALILRQTRNETFRRLAVVLGAGRLCIRACPPKQRPSRKAFTGRRSFSSKATCTFMTAAFSSGVLLTTSKRSSAPMPESFRPRTTRKER